MITKTLDSVVSLLCWCTILLLHDFHLRSSMAMPAEATIFQRVGKEMEIIKKYPFIFRKDLVHTEFLLILHGLQLHCEGTHICKMGGEK